MINKLTKIVQNHIVYIPVSEKNNKGKTYIEKDGLFYEKKCLLPHAEKLYAKYISINKLKDIKKLNLHLGTIKAYLIYYDILVQNDEFPDGKLPRPDQELPDFAVNALKNKVKALNNYYYEYDKVNMFSAQEKVRPTILEEYMFLLFQSYFKHIQDKYCQNNCKYQMSGAEAYTNLYFAPSSFGSFNKESAFTINVKDQDFAIFRTVILSDGLVRKNVNVPVFAIENKTYIDKPMLEGVIATAEKLKLGHPYARFVVVTEEYSVVEKVDPVYSNIDQIYVLRMSRRKNSPKTKKNIDSIPIIKLFDDTRRHLERPWCDINTRLTTEGVIMY